MQDTGTVQFSHKPVLLNECLELLNIRPSGTYVDCTLGGAGHSSEILKRLGSGGLLIGIDQDEEALAVSGKRLGAIETEGSFRTVKSNFADIKNVCDGIRPDGILIDLGVSSYQFDSPERGFSYRTDARLDMRMDRSQTKSAYEVVNEYTEAELTRIIRDYGEEKWAARIAMKIAEARKIAPVETTFQLSEIVKSAIPAKVRATGGHPAKQTFQAIRIEVNNELGVLETVLRDAIDILNEGGRLVIITFHSLEDRMVKNKFKEAENPCTCPPGFPVCICGKKPLGIQVTRKPVTAGEEELNENNRAHSAKVRAFEKRTEAGT